MSKVDYRYQKPVFGNPQTFEPIRHRRVGCSSSTALSDLSSQFMVEVGRFGNPA